MVLIIISSFLYYLLISYENFSVQRVFWKDKIYKQPFFTRLQMTFMLKLH